MNLIRFLLIDFVLILSGFLFLLIFQSNGKKLTSFYQSNGLEIQNSASKKIPDLNKILELETLARNKGSGIDFDQIIGLWKFVSVWEHGNDKESKFFSSLLRLFSASLELVKREVNQDLLTFEILNSIEFGVLSICFKGVGELKGAQPLLPFYFEEIQLKIGKDRVIRKSLDIPDEKERPFFALIGIGDDREWLAARGKGGGLAIWLKA